MTENKTARPESLEQVFLCYTKDNLQDIAKKHGLKGFSKWNKKDLAKWLKDQLLDENVMGEIVKKLLQMRQDSLKLRFVNREFRSARIW